jgi:hypothetical protein
MSSASAKASLASRFVKNQKPAGIGSEPIEHGPEPDGIVDRIEVGH